MFTGLIQAMGEVVAVEPVAIGARVAIRGPQWGGESPPVAPGESIAVSGCCLTVARIGSDVALSGTAAGAAGISESLLGFDVIHQTLAVTRLGRLAVGHRVNLERSVTPHTLLGGHIVQGHVDGVGRIEAVLREGGEWRVRIAPPKGLLRYISSKGSIAVDGVSLTVADLDDEAGTFDVCLIPETLSRTTLGSFGPGDGANLEVDCLAKMLERLTSGR